MRVACRKVGLARIDVVEIDGARVRANASLAVRSRRGQPEQELAVESGKNGG